MEIGEGGIWYTGGIMFWKKTGGMHVIMLLQGSSSRIACNMARDAKHVGTVVLYNEYTTQHLSADVYFLKTKIK